MATPISDLRAQLQREINITGFEQLPDVTNNDLDGYIADAFWEARLLGLLTGYTISGTNIQDDDAGDLPEYYQQLVVMVAGVRMLRLKIMNLATNIRAHAGPVEYEQQASATTLRAILAGLEDRINLLKALYSDKIGNGVFVYFDGALQREASILNAALDVQVY